MEYQSKLVALRKKHNLTQHGLASIIGINRGAYKQYELQYDIIPLKHLNKICNYFDISIDYILGLNNDLKYENSKNEIDYIKAGKRLKEFRKEHNLTQGKLASILNTVQPAIANYENGKHLISTSFLYEICKRYNISADYLLGKTNYDKVKTFL